MAATDVCTFDAALDHLNWSSVPAQRDAAELARHVAAASDLVDQLVGPVVIRQVTDAERSGTRIALDFRPVTTVVSAVPSFAVSPTPLTALRAHPTTGLVRHGDGARLTGGPWDITYCAGRVAATADVPAAMSLACCVIVAHLWSTQRAVTMGASMSADDFTAPVPAGYAIPYRARDLLAPYMQTVVV